MTADNFMKVDGMNVSDAAAYLLLARIADKAVEPLCDDTDPKKTLGETRKELQDLLFEAMQFVATRRSETSEV